MKKALSLQTIYALEKGKQSEEWFPGSAVVAVYPPRCELQFSLTFHLSIRKKTRYLKGSPRQTSLSWLFFTRLSLQAEFFSNSFAD